MLPVIIFLCIVYVAIIIITYRCLEDNANITKYTLTTNCGISVLWPIFLVKNTLTGIFYLLKFIVIMLCSGLYVFVIDWRQDL